MRKLQGIMARVVFWVALALFLSACSDSTDTPRTPGNAESWIWLEGSSLSGPNGLYVGPQHKLYIASALDSSIGIMDPQTGELERVLGAQAGVESPDDIAFNTTGTFCWTAILTGEVGCMNSEGKKTTAARLTPGVNPITFSRDGRLFVSQCFFGNKTYEVDPQGVQKPRLITDQLGPRCGLNGMDIGPDEKLYGPRWFQGDVVRLDTDSGRVESVVQGLQTPAAVKFDSQGRLHVIDSATGEVLRVTENGELEVLATLTPGLDNLAFDDSDRLFVSRSPDNDIIEVLDRGKTRAVNSGGLAVPGGMAYVSIQGKPSLVVTGFYSLRYIDPASGEPQKIVRDVFSVSDLGSVLTVHGNGDELILSSWMDGAVRSWNPLSDTLNRVYQGLGQPIDALRYGGKIVYSDAATDTVKQLIETSSEPHNAGDVTQRVLYQSAGGAAGLAIDEQQNLYLTEHLSGRLVLLAGGGRWLNTPRVISDGLKAPEGLYVDRGKAYVVQTGNRSLAEVDLATGEIIERITGLALGRPAIGDFPPTMIFSGVTGDGSGSLFLGGETGNVLYRWSP